MVQKDKASLALAEIEKLKKQLAALESNPPQQEAAEVKPVKDSRAAKQETANANPAKASEQPLSEQEQLEQLIEEFKEELSEHQGASILGSFALGFLLGRLIR